MSTCRLRQLCKTEILTFANADFDRAVSHSSRHLLRAAQCFWFKLGHSYHCRQIVWHDLQASVHVSRNHFQPCVQFFDDVQSVCHSVWSGTWPSQQVAARHGRQVYDDFLLDVLVCAPPYC